MTRILTIALVVSIAGLAASPANADPTAIDRLVAQERTHRLGLEPSSQTIDAIVAQERGRHADARVFGPAEAAPVQIVGPADGFDLGDAGIGGAAVLALALLATAAVSVRGNRRPGSAGSTSPGS